MRKRFEQQNTLDAVAIPEVKLNSKSRHQLPKLLAGLQYLFLTPNLNEQIFKILEEAVLKDKKKTGRLGMSLWELFVLGVVRQNMNMDYDLLYDQANNHTSLRGILGVDTKQVFYEGGKYYGLQTIKDNVSLLDEETLKKINLAVVQAGHSLKKKEKGEPTELDLKTDSYCVESKIHFPTDLNLLWDSARKCLDVLARIIKDYNISGWRKRKVWRNKIKKAYRHSSTIHRKKGANYKSRLQASTKGYLNVCSDLSNRIKSSLVGLQASSISDIKLQGLVKWLMYYHDYLEKFIDLVERRILKAEVIPHSEKVFSIFEPHVEWIQKGKVGKLVELGHNVAITSDQYQFIIDHEVMVGLRDKDIPIALGNRLAENFSMNYVLSSISFDRGFYSQLAKKALSKKFELVVMPKVGKKTEQQEQEETAERFVKRRKKHSAVESNINELEHAGADKILDKGLDGFKKSVAWSVVSYNLKRLGAIVLKQKLLPTAVKPSNYRKRRA